MADPNNRSTETPGDDATVEVARPELIRFAGGDSGSTELHACQVAFAGGATPEISRETAALLRRRLRLAAIVLFVGFAAFLIKHAFEANFGTTLGAIMFAFHALTTLVLGVLGLGLCQRRTYSLRALRMAEWLAFGVPTVFFAAVSYLFLRGTAARGSFDFPEGVWILLIFTYALFIPNTLRRAAVAISLLAAVPIGILAIGCAACPIVQSVANLEQVSSTILLLVLSAAAGVFGVDTIGTLRREAFEARQLGQYRLTRRIGAGGMGEVFLAEHRLLKRPCVIKLIRADKAGNPNVLARFQREVRATAKLTHWNTIEIFDYGVTQDGTFYYVMEFLPGLSLAQMVEQFGPLPAERVVYLLRQACDALHEAHAHGLIHRDIKPGNIFVAERGGIFDVVKLLDFGLVKPILDDESPDLTAEGSITGSPLFMSPEQAMGETQLDARSDVYSLGAVGYFLLTGQPLFSGDKPLKVLFAHIHQAVTPPSRIRDDVPADLEAVILRCLAKSPEGRYPDAASLEAALAECNAAGRWSRDDSARWWLDNVRAVPVPQAVTME